MMINNILMYITVFYMELIRNYIDVVIYMWLSNNNGYYMVNIWFIYG